MSKLIIISQPLKISDSELYNLEEEIYGHWDHKAENIAIRNARRRRRAFFNVGS